MATAVAPRADLETVADASRAGVLLHPLRLQILRRAAEPRSAADIAGALDLPRQKVNYHVRELFRAGFLIKAGRVRKRNLYGQRYVATARGYVLSPDVLGPVQADRRQIQDELSAAYLLALGAQMQSELGRAQRDAAAQGARLPTLSIDAELRFTSAAQRDRFATALRDAVAAVIAQHAAPATTAAGAPAAGRPYRLALGCYPIPPANEPTGSEP